jgi:hypothetical protein
LLNALAAFCIYPLAVRLTQNRWTGLVAVLTAAVLSPMPGFYVNWGRYTQLAGQVILPVALWLTWEMADYPQLNWRRLSLALIAVAGLALTHYRVLLFYIAILPAWWLVYGILAPERRPNWLHSLARLALLGACALAAISPWIANVVSSRLAQQQMSIAAHGDPRDLVRNEYNRFQNVRNVLPAPMLGAVGLGLVFGFVRRRPLALFAGLWTVALFILANPDLLQLPGYGVVNNFTALISLYIPASILVGYGLVSVAQYGRGYWRAAPWAIGVLVACASLWAARIQVQMVDAATFMLVTPVDGRAMTWIRTNTPSDARFLVNGAFAYGGVGVVGTDAGWWIPLLAGRENTIPPLTYVSETPLSPDYPRQVHDLMAQLEAADLATPQGWTLLKQYGITHIYIGQQEGRVWSPGPPLLSARALANVPYYEPVYHEDRVWIFEVHAHLVEEWQ